MNKVIIVAVLLLSGLFGGALLERYAVAENATSLPGLAEKIQKGQVDVGKQYGMALDRRFHKIHGEVLALECATCHAERVPAGTEIFASPPAVDVSKDSPGPIDRRVCVACHVGGVARKAYGP
jgi:hypothetical protein